MQIELTVLISLACAVLGAGISYLVFMRNSKKDAMNEGKNDGVVLTELGYIKSSVDDIKAEQRKTSESHTALVIEMTAVKRDLKTAFTRIDELKQDVLRYHPWEEKT